MTTKNAWTRLGAIALLAAMLAGCGLKGDLYLPAAQTTDTTAASDGTDESEDTGKSPDGN